MGNLSQHLCPQVKTVYNLPVVDCLCWRREGERREGERREGEERERGEREKRERERREERGRERERREERRRVYSMYYRRWRYAVYCKRVLKGSQAVLPPVSVR